MCGPGRHCANTVAPVGPRTRPNTILGKVGDAHAYGRASVVGPRGRAIASPFAEIAVPVPSMLEPIVAFFERFPPFHALDRPTLTSLANVVDIRYFAASEVVFREGESAPPGFYVVKKGWIALHRQGDAGEEELVEHCDEGDVFGLRALLRGRRYSATARAEEDSLVFVVPWHAFEALLLTHPQLSLYLAAGFAAERPRRAGPLLAATTAAQSGLRHRPGWRVLDDPPIAPVRDVLTCAPGTSIRAAAERMRDRRVGSIIIVDEVRRPLGIVTDTDLRDRVVSRGLDVESSTIADVMTSPVSCLKEPQTTASLVATAMQRRLRHFCFTESGTPASAVTGVLSEHDIVTTHGRHPTALQSRIARSRDPDELRGLRDLADGVLQAYLEQHAGMPLLCAIASGINDALVRSALAVAAEDLRRRGWERPAEPFCWLSLGSEGREEQLLRTDLDNAIVYADPPESRAASVARDYLAWAERTIEVLVHAGFERCKGNIMASNPELTLCVGDWKRKFAKLVRAPDSRALLEASIYFDFRPVEGAFELADALKRHIFAEIDAEPLFLAFLAKNALQNPPPLSFFRGFVLESSGERKNTFDIKARAMMPLVDGSRVLAYDLRLPYYGTTVGRFERIGAAEPDLAELCSEAAMAYSILLRARTEEGFRTASSGRYVDIQQLNKLERQSLRNAFSVVGELQRRLSMRYSTDQIRG